MRALAAILLAGAVEAHAAGGHFDVDDATALAPGRCQVETWLLAGRSPSSTFVHVGPACAWGGIEWGLNADRVRIDGARGDTLGPQAKWVVDVLAKRLSTGAAVAATWRTEGTSRPIATGYVPVTAWFGENQQLQLNLNAGRDHDPIAGSFRRWGIGADWTASDRWMLTAERRSVLSQALTRIGARWYLTPLASIDASVARAGGMRLLGVGFSWELER